MSNLPIFRGIDIKTGEVFIGTSILKDVWGNVYLIDGIRNGFNWDICHSVFPDTVAIHFSDMLASDSDRYLPNGEKDLRIFASLQEDGKGGDIVIILDTTFKVTYKYIKGKFLLDNNIDTFNPYVKFKTVGIQQ